MKVLDIMKNMSFIRQLKIIVLILTVLSIIVLPAYAQDMPDVQQIINKIDRLFRSDTSSGNMEMTIITENWSRTLIMEVWTEDLDKTLIHITAPKKDAGITTLRKDTEMWNYFPKINKVMKVPPSMMMSSWMGSDFTNDDLVKESSMTRDYRVKLINPEDAEPENYYVKLIPKEDLTIVWAKRIVAVRKKDYIPVWEAFYEDKGRKMRLMTFSDIKKFGDREIPSVLEMKSLNKPDKKTIIIYKNIEFDMELKPDVFTLRNLQRKR